MEKKIKEDKPAAKKRPTKEQIDKLPPQSQAKAIMKAMLLNKLFADKIPK